MTKRVLVDTSYLLELYRVPGCFEDAAHLRVSQKFAEAIANNYVLFLLVPVIYEMANHIADVPNGHHRIVLSKQFSNAIRTSLDNQTPWTILPNCDEQILKEILDSLSHVEAFAAQYANQRIGLTDVAIIEASKVLKARLSNFPQPRPQVIIWTRDNRLKAYEPDTEANPFV